MPRLTSLAVAAILLTLSLVSTSSVAQSRVLFVDGASVGGACSDGRTVEQAGSASSPWCSLDRAAAAAPRGSVVVVRAGSYGELDVEGGSRSEMVMFRAAAGEAVSIGGLELSSTSHLRFEGFQLRGQVALQGSHHLQVVGNDISPEGVMVRGSRDVLVEGNHIHDLRRDAGCPSAPSVGNGYAVWLNSSSGVRSARVTIRGNRIANVPHDAFQVGSTDDLLIEGNDVSGVEADGCGDHSDVLQIVEGERIVVRSNRFHDSVHGFMVNGHGDTFRGGLRFENNLIHGISGSFGMNLYNVEGLALVNNTVWDTALGVRLRDTTENPTVMRVSVRNNIFDQYSSECDSVGCVTYQDHNLIGRGDRRGAHDLAGSPSFVDAAVGNYELAPGSRGIDAASSDDAPATDRLGRGRSDDPATANSGTGTQTHYDIGAHERFLQDDRGTGGRERGMARRLSAASYRRRIARARGLIAYWPLGGDASGARRRAGLCTRHGIVRRSRKGALPGSASARFIGRGHLRCGKPRALRLRRGSLEAWIRTRSRRRRQVLMRKPGAVVLELIRGRVAVRGGSGRKARLSRRRVADGRWHHLVVTFRKGRRRGVKLYVDGRRALRARGAAKARRGPVYIGSGRSGARRYVGLVDEVAVYRTVLSPRAVRRHHRWAR
jgi:Concanavalin A-like lectin/glucanases superfamily/Right handed beta helix region